MKSSRDPPPGWGSWNCEDIPAKVIGVSIRQNFTHKVFLDPWFLRYCTNVHILNIWPFQLPFTFWPWASLVGTVRPPLHSHPIHLLWSLRAPSLPATRDIFFWKLTGLVGEQGKCVISRNISYDQVLRIYWSRMFPAIYRRICHVCGCLFNVCNSILSPALMPTGNDHDRF